MADYIERAELIREIISDMALFIGDSDAVQRHDEQCNYAISCVENAPAADVVPVVRCKDCDAWKRNVGIVDSPNGHCFEHDIDTNGQDFCSYGKRRNGQCG